MKRVLLFVAFCLPAVAVAHAQAFGSWAGVQALPVGQGIRVSTEIGTQVCDFTNATDDDLFCTQSRSLFRTGRLIFRRSEVISVKLSRKPLSGLAGAAVLGGVGAGIGAGIEATEKGNDDPHLLTTVFGLLGAGTGAIVGSRTDFLAGPLVYRRVSR